MKPTELKEEKGNSRADAVAAQGYVSVTAVRQTMAKLEAEKAHADGRPRGGKGSSTAVRGFMKRWGLSIHKPHLKRRPQLDEEEKTARIGTLRKELKECRDRGIGPKRCWNVDATSIKLFAGRRVTVAVRGDDRVVMDPLGDEKATLTLVVFINQAGDIGPAYLIARGVSEGCRRRWEDQFAEWVHAGKLRVLNQVNAWCDTEVEKTMYEDFANFAQVGPDAPAVLLQDCFAAQRDTEVRKFTEDLGFVVLFIPAGMTGDCQPLDVRIFGEVKPKAAVLYDESMASTDSPAMYAPFVSLESYLQVLFALARDHIIKAWSVLVD
jgi:hypothetical protein